jgi:hypothetical protein
MSPNPTIIVEPQPELQGSRSALLHDELAESPEQKTTLTPPPIPEPTPRFDWADDAESIPIMSKPPPRDFSVLRSNTPRPFDSIQRQTRRRNQMRNPPIRSFTRRSQPAWSMGPVVTHRYPFGSGQGSPKVVIPSPRPHEPSPKLDWDGDPRLADLSRVLRSLGWAPTC